jgi:PilZ domain
MIDRRSIRRTRVAKQAKILANRCSIPCTVIDLTNSGACISLARGQTMPDRFELTFGSRQPRRTCRVTWRSDNQIGVAFEPTKN